MHELQFMTNLVRMVEDVCEKQSSITPFVIKLQVASDSHLAGHTQEELQTLFHFVARGTRVGQATLAITTTIVTGQCQDCQTTVLCQGETPTCPTCDSLNIDKETCPEVVVKEIDFHEPST